MSRGTRIFCGVICGVFGVVFLGKVGTTATSVTVDQIFELGLGGLGLYHAAMTLVWMISGAKDLHS